MTIQHRRTGMEREAVTNPQDYYIILDAPVANLKKGLPPYLPVVYAVRKAEYVVVKP